MHGPKWTDEETERFIAMWRGSRGDAPSFRRLALLVCQFPGRNVGGLYARAQRLRLVGVPQGHATIPELAREAGYDPRTLRRILAWAEVKTHVRASRWMRRGRGRGHREHANAAEAIEAVERWLRFTDEHETIRDASRARGVHEQSFRAEMRRRGVEPVRTGAREKWIDRETADAIAAAIRARKEVPLWLRRKNGGRRPRDSRPGDSSGRAPTPPSRAPTTPCAPSARAGARSKCGASTGG